MPLMPEYTEIIVEDEQLLPQVVREILAMTDNPNWVEVTYGVSGRVILVHPDLAEAWYQQATADSEDPDEVPIPVPVKRGPGRPRKIHPAATSASNGEES